MSAQRSPRRKQALPIPVVSYLAHELGITSEEARKLIDRFGGNRDKIYAAAETLKQGRQN
jgi:hypothetical protein